MVWDDELNPEVQRCAAAGLQANERGGPSSSPGGNHEAHPSSSPLIGLFHSLWGVGDGAVRRYLAPHLFSDPGLAWAKTNARLVHGDVQRTSHCDDHKRRWMEAPVTNGPELVGGIAFAAGEFFDILFAFLHPIPPSRTPSVGWFGDGFARWVES